MGGDSTITFYRVDCELDRYKYLIERGWPEVGGEPVLNITECIDALDRERTTYRADPDFDDFELAGFDEDERRRLLERRWTPVVEEPVFRLDRLGWQLFKLPETAIVDIYYWERNLDGPEEQFRRVCEREGLTGLTFTPMYTTDCPW